uniref:Carbohydrate sulfotransferase n=1 Tax=Hirondellea gigas TaxID=1518452 RepID=A0A6A7FSE5_9CRUS
MRVCRARVLVSSAVALLLLLLCSLLLLLMAADTPDASQIKPAHVVASPETAITPTMQQRVITLTEGCSKEPSAGATGNELLSSNDFTVKAMRADTQRQGYQYLAHALNLLNHIIVDDKHKALYCYVPKVACTNWKRLMMILSGSTNQTDPLRIPADSVHRQHALTKLDSFAPAEIVNRLQSYKKFLFVRDPLERLLSAFRNKFEKNYASSAYFKRRFGVKIQRLFRRGEDSLNVSPTGDGTTFAEFVSYLVLISQQKPDALNEHWAPVVQLCQPCLVRYDYIGKYESLDKDSAAILTSLEAPPGLTIPAAKPSVTSSLLPEYLAGLTPTQRLQLQQVFADDIVLFGYSYRDHHGRTLEP